MGSFAPRFHHNRFRVEPVFEIMPFAATALLPPFIGPLVAFVFTIMSPPPEVSGPEHRSIHLLWKVSHPRTTDGSPWCYLCHSPSCCRNTSAAHCLAPAIDRAPVKAVADDHLARMLVRDVRMNSTVP